MDSPCNSPLKSNKFGIEGTSFNSSIAYNSMTSRTKLESSLKKKVNSPNSNDY